MQALSSEARAPQRCLACSDVQRSVYRRVARRRSHELRVHSSAARQRAHPSTILIEIWHYGFCTPTGIVVPAGSSAPFQFEGCAGQPAVLSPESEVVLPVVRLAWGDGR
jgi:hypothetical protein